MVAQHAAILAGLLFALPVMAQVRSQAPSILTYKRVARLELKAHVFKPTNPMMGDHAAIVLFHGGGWSAGCPEWTYSDARRFASRGMVAVSIQYRLSDQKEITPLDAMEDARDAIRWVRNQATSLGVDPKRVAVFGVSAGGHLAAAAATIGRGGTAKPDLSAVPDVLLLYSPAIAVAHDGWLRRLLLGRAKPDEVSPDQFVCAGLPPTFIIHGEEDSLTPFGGAFRFCRNMKESGNHCELRHYAGLGHLLTRKLDEQESEFDPDPEARADAGRAEELFLTRLGFIRDGISSELDGPEAVVRSLTNAINTHDLKTLAKCVAEDTVWFEVQGDQIRREFTGREALLKSLENRFKTVSSGKTELNMLSANGAMVSVRERVTGKDSQGNPCARNVFALYEICGGKVKHAWHFQVQK